MVKTAVSLCPLKFVMCETKSFVSFKRPLLSANRIPRMSTRLRFLLSILCSMERYPRGSCHRSATNHTLNALSMSTSKTCCHYNVFCLWSYKLTIRFNYHQQQHGKKQKKKQEQPWKGLFVWSNICALTGSAHTVLGSYWSKKLGKKKLLGNFAL